MDSPLWIAKTSRNQQDFFPDLTVKHYWVRWQYKSLSYWTLVRIVRANQGRHFFCAEIFGWYSYPTTAKKLKILAFGKVRYPRFSSTLRKRTLGFRVQSLGLSSVCLSISSMLRPASTSSLTTADSSSQILRVLKGRPTASASWSLRSIRFFLQPSSSLSSQLIFWTSLFLHLSPVSDL